MPGLADILLAVGYLVGLPILAGSAIAAVVGWPARAYVGALAVGMVVVVGHGLRVPQSLALAGGAAVAMGLAALARKRRSAERAAPLSAQEKAVVAALAALLFPAAASAALRALHDPVLAWDGLKIWYAKARAAYFWDPIALDPRPAYPELGPVLWMLPMRWLGPGFENVGRAFLPVAYFAWVAGLPAVLGRPYGWTALAAALVSAMMAFDVAALTNGYQDAFVLVTAGFATATWLGLLLRIDAARASGDPGERNAASPDLVASGDRAAMPGPPSALVAAGVLTGALPMMKQEGMVWSLLLGGAFLGSLFWAPIRSWRRLARAVLPFVAAWVIASAAWPLLLAWNGIEASIQGNAFTFGSISRAFRQLDRWPAIRVYAQQYLDGHLAAIAACALASGAALVFAPRLRRALALLWTVLLLGLAFVVLVFLATREDLAWHLQTAFARLASQADFVYVLLAFVALGGIGQKITAHREKARAEPAPSRG